MAREEREESGEQAQEKPARKGGGLIKVLLIGVAALVLLAGVAVGGLYLFRTMTASAEKPKAPQAVIGQLWPMETFIVNLRDNNGDRYLKAVLQLEVSAPEVVTELNLLKPKLRDSTLDLLSSKSYQELQEPSGKQKLRDDLMMRLNSFLTSGKIVRVYFTEFVIQ